MSVWPTISLLRALQEEGIIKEERQFPTAQALSSELKGMYGIKFEYQQAFFLRYDYMSITAYDNEYGYAAIAYFSSRRKRPIRFTTGYHFVYEDGALACYPYLRPEGYLEFFIEPGNGYRETLEQLWYRKILELLGYQSAWLRDLNDDPICIVPRRPFELFARHQPRVSLLSEIERETDIFFGDVKNLQVNALGLNYSPTFRLSDMENPANAESGSISES